MTYTKSMVQCSNMNLQANKTERRSFALKKKATDSVLHGPVNRSDRALVWDLIGKPYLRFTERFRSWSSKCPLNSEP